MSAPDEAGVSRFHSDDEWERAVHAEAERRELSTITRSLSEAQRALEARIQTTSDKLEKNLQAMRTEWAEQSRDMAERYRRLDEEWRMRRDQFRIGELNPAQAAKLVDMVLFYDTSEPMLKAIVQQYMTSAVVSEAHKRATTRLGNTFKLIGAIAAAVVSVATFLGVALPWLSHHIH